MISLYTHKCDFIYVGKKTTALPVLRQISQNSTVRTSYTEFNINRYMNLEITDRLQQYTFKPIRTMLKHNIRSLYINPDRYQRTSTPCSGGSTFNTSNTQAHLLKYLLKHYYLNHHMLTYVLRKLL
jgi:mannitol-1-phosphate/altronate dehydrogenase